MTVSIAVAAVSSAEPNSAQSISRDRLRSLGSLGIVPHRPRCISGVLILDDDNGFVATSAEKFATPTIRSPSVSLCRRDHRVRDETNDALLR